MLNEINKENADNDYGEPVQLIEQEDLPTGTLPPTNERNDAHPGGSLNDDVYDFHELADIFPITEGGPDKQLVESIKRFGFSDEILLFEDKIVWERDLYLAGREARVPLRFKHLDGRTQDEVIEIILNRNLLRRQLNQSQKAMCAIRYATFKAGRPPQNAQISAISQSEAATRFGISRGQVQKAQELDSKGTRELLRAVDEGKITINAALKISAFPEVQQRKITAMGKADIKKAVKVLLKSADRRSAKSAPGTSSTSLPFPMEGPQEQEINIRRHEEAASEQPHQGYKEHEEEAVCTEPIRFKGHFEIELICEARSREEALRRMLDQLVNDLMEGKTIESLTVEADETPERVLAVCGANLITQAAQEYSDPPPDQV